MPDGGSLRAFFKGAQEDVAQAVENAAGKMASLGEDTAQGIRDSVSTIRNADSANVDAIIGIRGKAGNSPSEGGAAAGGSTEISRMLSPDGTADGKVVDKVAQMQSAMTDGEVGRTTYAAAVVKMASGNEETWVAAAGRKGYVRPAVRGDAVNVRAPAPAELSDLPHINDAEMHLYRSAQEQGASIISVGATRPVCSWCQERLPDEISIATELGK